MKKRVTTAPTAGGADKLDGTVLRIASVVVLGAIMSILDITVVSVALPTFQDKFHTDYATVAWTMTGYTLALATVIPITGWAADRFGTKRLYMLALVLFVAGSAACSTAWNIESLIGFRVLQGLGGGMLMPLGMTIMTKAAGPHRIGRVMAVLGIPMMLGPIGGPILGGWMIESFSWQWIFLINVPIGAIALVMAAVILPKDNPSPSESFDWKGMLMMSPGLALFLFGVSSIPDKNTLMDAKTGLPMLVGALLVIGFVFYSFKPKHPLVDLRLFKNGQMTKAVITMFLFAMAFFGAMLLIPSYFLQVRGESTLDAGLLMAPQGLGAMIMMPFAGRLADKIPTGRVVLSGLVLIIIGMGVMTQTDEKTSYTLVLGALFVMGLGMGATMMPLMTTAMQTLSQQMVARGSTLMNIVQQIASSAGTAIMSVVLTNQIKESQLAQAAIGSRHDPSIVDKMTQVVIGQGVPPEAAPGVVQQSLDKGFSDAAGAFSTTFTVAWVLIIGVFLVAFLLPLRKKAKADADGTGGGEDRAPMLVH